MAKWDGKIILPRGADINAEIAKRERYIQRWERGTAPQGFTYSMYRRFKEEVSQLSLQRASFMNPEITSDTAFVESAGAKGLLKPEAREVSAPAGTYIVTKASGERVERTYTNTSVSDIPMGTGMSTRQKTVSGEGIYFGPRGEGYSIAPDIAIVKRTPIGFADVNIQERGSGRKEVISTGVVNIYGRDVPTEFVNKPYKNKIDTWLSNISSTEVRGRVVGTEIDEAGKIRDTSSGKLLGYYSSAQSFPLGTPQSRLREEVDKGLSWWDTKSGAAIDKAFSPMDKSVAWLNTQGAYYRNTKSSARIAGYPTRFFTDIAYPSVKGGIKLFASYPLLVGAIRYFGYEGVTSDYRNVVSTGKGIIANRKDPTMWGSLIVAGKISKGVKSSIPLLTDKNVLTAKTGELVPLQSRAQQVETILGSKELEVMTGRRKVFGNKPTNAPLGSVDYTFGVPIEFATYTVEGVKQTSGIFTKPRFFKTFGQEILGRLNVDTLKTADVPIELRSSIKEQLYSKGKVDEPLIEQYFSTAQRQADVSGEPVVAISPKRLRGYAQPELEAVKILPKNYGSWKTVLENDEVIVKAPRRYFAGFTEEWTPIFTSEPISKVFKERVSQWKLSGGEFGFESTRLNLFADIAKQKYESQIMGTRREFAGEYSYHGREHIVGDFLSSKGGQRFDWGHDILKVSDVDSYTEFRHGETASNLLKSGRFPDKSIYKLPLSKQLSIAEAYAGHEYYRPSIKSIFSQRSSTDSGGLLSSIGKRGYYWFVGKSNPDLRRIASLDRYALKRLGITPKQSLIAPEWRIEKQQKVSSREIIDFSDDILLSKTFRRESIIAKRLGVLEESKNYFDYNSNIGKNVRERKVIITKRGYSQGYNYTNRVSPYSISSYSKGYDYKPSLYPSIYTYNKGYDYKNSYNNYGQYKNNYPQPYTPRYPKYTYGKTYSGGYTTIYPTQYAPPYSPPNKPPRPSTNIFKSNIKGKSEYKNKEFSSSSFSYRYLPSVSAVGLGIFGKRPKGRFSGLEIRPQVR